MKILTADEMRVADRVTTDRFGVSSLELMEHAGRAVARFVLREFPHCRRIVVLCGKGNNGGDGLVAARYLAEAGCAVSVADPGGSLRRAWRIQGHAGSASRRAPITIQEEADLNRDGCKGLLEGAQLFVDAVLGTGFRPPMRGLAVAGRKLLERYPQTPVVAVDLPSGWEADSRASSHRTPIARMPWLPLPRPSWPMFRECSPAACSRFPESPARAHRGGAASVRPAEAIESATGLTWAGGSKAIADRPRAADSNKGRFGHVLVDWGSEGQVRRPLDELCCRVARRCRAWSPPPSRNRSCPPSPQ